MKVYKRILGAQGNTLCDCPWQSVDGENNDWDSPPQISLGQAVTKAAVKTLCIAIVRLV